MNYAGLQAEFLCQLRGDYFPDRCRRTICAFYSAVNRRRISLIEIFLQSGHANPTGRRFHFQLKQNKDGHAPNVARRKNHTRSFSRVVIDLRKLMTIEDVALYLGVCTRMVRDIDKDWRRRCFAKLRLRDLEGIAIDEISIFERPIYLTIVMDLKTGVIVFVGYGKGGNALEPFWTRVRGSNVQVRAVAVEMSSVY